MRKEKASIEELEPEKEGRLNESIGNSEPGSLARRDGGLGSSKKQENDLILQLRQRNGYESCDEGITMRGYEDLDPGESGDDAATLAVLKRIDSLGNFRAGDFVVSEEAARLARRMIKKYRKARSEFTRKTIHKITIAVLRECWLSYGHSRVRLKPMTLLEVLDWE